MRWRGKNRFRVWSGVIIAGSLCGARPAWSQDTVWKQHVVPWMHFSTHQQTGTSTPTEAIKALDRMLNDYRTGTHLTDADREFNRQLKKQILAGTFDIHELCRIALGKHWLERTAEEREHMVNLMTSLMEEKAVTSKEQTAQKVKGKEVYHVQYAGEKSLNPQHNRVLVLTKTTVPSRKITIQINYKLERHNDDWRIYDVIVDESSLVENYTYQFDSIITEHGYADIVQRMERKLQEIRAEQSS